MGTHITLLTLAISTVCVIGLTEILKFDLQVRRSFIECCMGGCGNDPEKEMK